MMPRLVLIEQLLQAERSSQLGAQGYAELPESVWSASLEVLNVESVTGDEQDALDVEVEGKTLDPIARLLALRIERALQAGLEAAGAGETMVLPEVHIFRAPEGGSRAEEGRVLASALARLRTGLSAGLSGSKVRLIVIVAKSVGAGESIAAAGTRRVRRPRLDRGWSLRPCTG